MNFQSLVRLFHFYHFRNTGQNTSEVLVLPVREFEIAFSLWQQYPETWITVKSVASRAAGGRLCTNSKALVISHIFNNCQINKKRNEICMCLRTVNLASWNLISPLYRRWTLLFEISSVSFQKAVTSVKHFSLKRTPDFFCLCMLQEHQVVNQQKYKMRQDRWSRYCDWHFIFILQPLFSSSSCNDLVAVLVYTVETDEKHGYSEGKPPLVHPSPVGLDCWWPSFWEYWYSPKWAMKLEVNVAMNFVNVRLVWVRWKCTVWMRFKYTYFWFSSFLL